MRRTCLVLAGLTVLAWQTRGPAQYGVDPARSYEVTPEAGPWMISTQYYQGPEAKAMACKLIGELRSAYRVPAYLFNYGAEEKRAEEARIQKERARIQDLLRKQEEWLQKQKLEERDMDFGAMAPIHIRTHKIEDQCVVLIGGYRDEATARRELDGLRRLPSPDPKKVPLAIIRRDNPNTHKDEAAFLSPFARAFVVHNPTIKQAPRPPEKPDPILITLNRAEEFSLLRCPKKFTLAVAQFQGASTIVSDNDKNVKANTNDSFLSHLGQGGEPCQALNAAAWNAHEVAKLLKNLQMESYVLHARYYSMVTVGGFDSLDDPRLQATRRQLTQLKPTLEKLPMLPEAVPVAIPHP